MVDMIFYILHPARTRLDDVFLLLLCMMHPWKRVYGLVDDTLVASLDYIWIVPNVINIGF